jgi:hypothetical protein
MGHWPGALPAVAVAARAGAPLTTPARSLLTKSVIAQVKAGLAAPWSRDAPSAVTVGVAGLAASVPPWQAPTG